MAKDIIYNVNIYNLTSAIGTSLPDYTVSPIGPLVAKVLGQLERMIATGAPDSETGDVVDPMIDAWVTQELALLAQQRTRHEQVAEELTIQAAALSLRAERHAKEADDDLHEAQLEHEQIMSTARALDQRTAGTI